MLIGSGQETACGLSQWSVEFHRRERGWQSNGVSEWSRTGAHLLERPGISTDIHTWVWKVRQREVTWGELVGLNEPEAVLPNRSSCDSLTRVVFREQLVLSTLPEDWGWYGIWKCQVMSRALDRIWEIWEVNSGPLSHWREVETPNWGRSLGRGAQKLSEPFC